METVQQLREEVGKYKFRQQQLSSRIEELTDFIENAVRPLNLIDGQGTIVWANEAELDWARARQNTLTLRPENFIL